MGKCETGLFFGAQWWQNWHPVFLFAGPFLGSKDGPKIGTFWSSGQRNCARIPGTKMGPLFVRRIIFFVTQCGGNGNVEMDFFCPGTVPGWEAQRLC